MEDQFNIIAEVEKLIRFALSKKLISSDDTFIVRNSLLDLLGLSEAYSDGGPIPDYTRGFDQEDIPQTADDIRNNILQYCYEKGMLPDSTVTRRDMLSARIMGYITPKPSEVVKRFNDEYRVSPMNATSYLYNLCINVNYIHGVRMKKNFYWDNEEPYGRLEFVNSFQHPEKTAQELEFRHRVKKGHYPRCELCLENMGYAGDLWHEARQNLRVVPLNLAEKRMYLQYSTEQYYGEHFFIAGAEHQPMELGEKAYEIMLEFVEKFPHCFIGLDAPLPGLGNFCPEHGFYRGGYHMFPIEYAETLGEYSHEIFRDVRASILKWPVSVIRLESDDTGQMIKLINFINNFWKTYDDEDMGIISFTEEGDTRTPHNALTVAVRKNMRGIYEADIALRNNRASRDRPNGVFAQRDELRHIKSGGVGLIDIMGLCAFSESFDSDLLHIMSYLISGRLPVPGKDAHIDKHFDWVTGIVEKYGAVGDYETTKNIVLYETSRGFASVLEDCGLFKMDEEGTEAFKCLMEDLGFTEEGEL